MSQAKSSIIIQAKIGKIDLRSYLNLISTENSRNCPYREEAQSVLHIFFYCPEFEELKETI